ncbi:hypothetical protein DDB_G0290995 [Dictyostelium discoideum AX4]|uniref:Band 7 domain-containing protein n=1 Tax=Dictyostelium discoideum TaxID=44689 RepID=Q54F95_DICDI|nr:hypothetical protein DDB_G0290995 [Dictyostelium discoideum AX4]EAL61928.1 hypothetical protein DDB_G0290995 [Dictyostelium discoideum AX4]|eukprot:XP_635442.1 hypothetical protein DDB_G0290995 [Dictyostelium discoideum AX4]
MFINRFINKISISGKNLINKRNENIFRQINLYTINQQKREFFTKIEQNELGVRYTFGKIGKKILGPGLRLMVPLIHDIELFDTRSSTQHLPKQTLVTLDGVVLSIDSIIQYKVVDPLKLVQDLKDHDESIENLVQIKLIEMVPKKTLAQLLYERDGFNKELVDSVNETFESWGINLESFTLSDIIFTQDVSNAMSKKVEAEFIKDSRLLLAQSELISSKILVEAASELEKSPFAMRLRELESIESISKDPSKSFIFVPTSIIDTFSRVINNKNTTNSVNEDNNNNNNKNNNNSDEVKKNIEK